MFKWVTTQCRAIDENITDDEVLMDYVFNEEEEAPNDIPARVIITEWWGWSFGD